MIDVLCEIVFTLVCVYNVLHVRKSFRGQGHGDKYLWYAAFTSVGAASLCGALNYAGCDQLQIMKQFGGKWTIAALHHLLATIAGFFGALNLSLAAYISIDQGPVAISQSFARFLLGLTVGLQAWILSGPSYKHADLLHSIQKFTPLLSMVILGVLSTLALLRGIRGVKRVKCTWLLCGIVIFAIGDSIRVQRSMTLDVTPKIRLDNIDLYHLLGALAMFCFGNVAHPVF